MNGLNVLGVDYFKDTSSGYFYPWNPATPVAENYKLASAGQLKVVFALRLSELDVDSPDNPDDENNNGIPDDLEDALNIIQLTGADRYLPKLYVTDTWEVKAYSYDGQVLVGESIDFQVIQGSGSFSGGDTADTLTTNASGAIDIDAVFNQQAGDRVRVVLSTSLGSAVTYLPASINGESTGGVHSGNSGVYSQAAIFNPNPPEVDDNGPPSSGPRVPSLRSVLSAEWTITDRNGGGAESYSFPSDPFTREIQSSEAGGVWGWRHRNTVEVDEFSVSGSGASGLNSWPVNILVVGSHLLHTVGTGPGETYCLREGSFLAGVVHNADALDSGGFEISADALAPASGGPDIFNRLVFFPGANWFDITSAEFARNAVSVPSVPGLEDSESPTDQDWDNYGKIVSIEYPFEIASFGGSVDNPGGASIDLSFNWNSFDYYARVNDGGGWSENDSGSFSFSSPGAEGVSFQFIARNSDSEPQSSNLTLDSTWRGLPLEDLSIDLIPAVSSTPDSPITISASANDISSPKYRKIGLNGLPVPDSKPQTDAENDIEPEETYVDALTLDLAHSVTDVYIPVPASELALNVRRNASPSIWTEYSGLRPSEEPDAAFGAGWSSNLTSYVLLNEQTSDEEIPVYIKSEDEREEERLSQTSPNTATVVDENGSAYSFIINYQGGGRREFLPTPTSKTQLDSHLVTLEEVAGGYVFTKKFGTKLYFGSGISYSLSNNRVEGSHQHTSYEYFRLNNVEDRAGNSLSYTYGAGGLVPTSIQVDGRSDLRVSIVQDSSGRVQSVQDANGNRTNYSYRGESGALGSSVTTLASVTGATGSTTTYNYSTAIQSDPKAASQTSTGDDLRAYDSDFNRYSVDTAHVNLSSIDGPYANDTITFSYGFDTSRKSYSMQPEFDSEGMYIQDLTGNHVLAGVPRNVTRITLPGNRVTTISGNHTITSNSSGDLTVGARTTTVNDPEGNRRVYTWSDFSITNIPDSYLIYLDSDDPTRINRMQQLGMSSMRIDFSGNGVNGREMYNFNPQADYEISSITDFSGNVTSYTYNDAVIGSELNHKHSDPNIQRNAMGDNRSYKYDATTRVMTEMEDELGRVTRYKLDESSQVSTQGPFGRRTTETNFDESGAIIAQMKFFYEDSRFPSFMTKKVVMDVGTNATNDPNWVTRLTTFYDADSNGRVVKTTIDLDASGSKTAGDLVTDCVYDSNGNKLSSTDPKGYQTGFNYDGLNRLIKVTYADGSTMGMTYDHRSNKVMETDENGISSAYVYDHTNRMVSSVRDMNENLSYNVTNNSFSGIDSSTDLISLMEYNDVNSVERVTDPRGYITITNYDGLQRPVMTISPSADLAPGVTPSASTGYVTSMSYSTSRNTGGSAFDVTGFKPTSITDPRGYTTHAVYDNLYRATDTWTEYADQQFARNRSDFDAVGNVIRATTWRTPADETGALYNNNSVQFESLIVETEYDALNRPLSVVNAAGSNLESTNETFYTSTGFAYRTVEQIDATTTRDSLAEFDPAGRPTLTRGAPVYDPVTDSFQRPITSTEYDANSNVIRTTNPLGNTWDYNFDVRNRQVQEIQPAVTDATTAQSIRPVTTTEYDAVGNVVSSTDPRLLISFTEYDDAYRVTQTTSPSVYISGAATTLPIITTQVYDENSNVLSVTDGNGNAIINTYDALNRLVTTKTNPEVVASDEDHPADIIVTNSYDQTANLLEVIDGEGQVTQFEYDGLNRKTHTHWDADDASRIKTEQTIYDAIVATEQRNPNEAGIVSYSNIYDARFRVAQVLYPSRPVDNRTLSYDLADRKLSCIHPNAADTNRDSSYSYDNLDRTTSESSSGVTHTYTYDLAGNSLNTTYGNIGRALDCTYDALNRLSTMTESGRTTQYRYDLSGNIIEKELPSGQISLMGYDALNRKAFISNETNSGIINSFDYQYDAIGNVTHIQEHYSSGDLSDRSVINVYDRAYRLTSETNDEVNGDTTITTYGYDRANNRVNKLTSGGSSPDQLIYTYGNSQNGANSNQIVSYTKSDNSTISFTYDANGNRETKSVDSTLAQSYTYDLNNRLLTVYDNDLGDFSYEYDGRTRRVLRDESAASGNSTLLSFSGGVSVQEYDSGAITATATVEHIRGSDYGGGIGGILYSLRGGIPSYNTYNSRGDVVSKTDDAGNVTWEASYEAFGTRVAEEGSTDDRQKANTKDEDPTGLLNEHFRYRDLEAGVFITRDPAGFVDGPNVYTYVRQNPWSYFDPYGLFSDPTGTMAATLAGDHKTAQRNGKQFKANLKAQVDTAKAVVKNPKKLVTDAGFREKVVVSLASASLLKRNRARLRGKGSDKQITTQKDTKKQTDQTVSKHTDPQSSSTANGPLNKPEFDPETGFPLTPVEPYNRRKHYGSTPTKSDRKAVGAEEGEVADHDPPLVKRYYEGDPATGEKPGFQMTKDERRASAKDRERMAPQPRKESDQQGGNMSQYSKKKKKELGL